MTNVKSLIARFRAWQREPFQHKNKNCGVVRCHNCGAEFDANFCPICGQEANIGRITWQSVKGNLLNVWGIGNRSMSYSLLQLFFRTGHFIRDYISGKRQKT